MWAQVRREMRFLMSPQMRHPHIVRGLDTFQDVTALYLVQARLPLNELIYFMCAYTLVRANLQEFAEQGDLFDVATRFPKRQLPEKAVSERVRPTSSRSSKHIAGWISLG